MQKTEKEAEKEAEKETEMNHKSLFFNLVILTFFV